MSAATVTAAADSNAIVDFTGTAYAANKTWTFKRKMAVMSQKNLRLTGRGK